MNKAIIFGIVILFVSGCTYSNKEAIVDGMEMDYESYSISGNYFDYGQFQRIGYMSGSNYKLWVILICHLILSTG